MPCGSSRPWPCFCLVLRWLRTVLHAPPGSWSSACPTGQRLQALGLALGSQPLETLLSCRWHMPFGQLPGFFTGATSQARVHDISCRQTPLLIPMACCHTTWPGCRLGGPFGLSVACSTRSAIELSWLRGVLILVLSDCAFLQFLKAKSYINLTVKNGTALPSAIPQRNGFQI